MKTRLARCALPLALVGLLAACATMGGLRQEALTEGRTRTFSAPLGQVVNAARQAMVEVGIAISDSLQPSPTARMLLGRTRTSLWSNGELVRVVAQEAGGSQTTVFVITRRRGAMDVFAKEDWSSAIFDQVQWELSSSAAGPAPGLVTVSAGARVRLTRLEQGPTMQGELRALRSDTLVVYDPVLSREITLAVGQLRSLEILRGRRTAARSASLVGTVIGALAGGVWAGSSYKSGGIIDYGQDGEALMGAVVGAAAGGLVGFAVGSRIATERREPVPLDRLKVGAAPRSAGSPVSGVALRF